MLDNLKSWQGSAGLPAPGRRAVPPEAAPPQPTDTAAQPVPAAPTPWGPAGHAEAAPSTETHKLPIVHADPTEEVDLSQLPPPPAAAGYAPGYGPNYPTGYPGYVSDYGGNVARPPRDPEQRSIPNRTARWAGRTGIGVLGWTFRHVAPPAAVIGLLVGGGLLWDATARHHGDWGWNKQLVPWIGIPGTDITFVEPVDVSTPDIDIIPSFMPEDLSDGDGIDLLPPATLPYFVSTTTTTTTHALGHR